MGRGGRRRPEQEDKGPLVLPCPVLASTAEGFVRAGAGRCERARRSADGQMWPAFPSSPNSRRSSITMSACSTIQSLSLLPMVRMNSCSNCAERSVQCRCNRFPLPRLFAQRADRLFYNMPAPSLGGNALSDCSCQRSACIHAPMRGCVSMPTADWCRSVTGQGPEPSSAGLGERSTIELCSPG